MKTNKNNIELKSEKTASSQKISKSTIKNKLAENENFEKKSVSEEELYQMIKELGDNRSKLSALFSLYNSALLNAEEDRSTLGNCFEQMVDIKNDLNSISISIGNAKKSEKRDVFLKHKTKIKNMNGSINELNSNFTASTKKYKLALQECGSLKTEYKHQVSEICKNFKSSVDENTPAIIIKGYKQQVRLIKAILDRIEQLVFDYNSKKAKVEEDNARFIDLYNSVETLIDKLQEIA